MALYHIRARTVSRASGASAAAAASYLLRLGRYAKAGHDPCVFSHAGNMPAWAAGPRQRLSYWSACDAHERANGRLFKSLEFALPRELSHAQRVALAREFCARVARTEAGEPLPFLMALHAGNKGSNPHCHVMVNERVVDGHHRTPELWFSRAAPKGKKPESGGSKKTQSLMPKAWLLATRELLARLTNEALTAAGYTVRVDHRSLADQGIDRVPGLHLGPAGAARLRRGKHSRRAEDLAQYQAAAQEVAQLMTELAQEAGAVELELANTLRSDPSHVAMPDLAERRRAALDQARREYAKPSPSPTSQAEKSKGLDYGPSR